MEDNEKTFPEFYERIQKVSILIETKVGIDDSLDTRSNSMIMVIQTIDVLKTAKRENFKGKENQEVRYFIT